MNPHEKYYVLNGSLLIKKNHTREWTFGMKILHNKIRWQIHKEIRSKMKPVFHGSHYSVVLKKPIEIVPPKNRKQIHSYDFISFVGQIL